MEEYLTPSLSTGGEGVAKIEAEVRAKIV